MDRTAKMWAACGEGSYGRVGSSQHDDGAALRVDDHALTRCETLVAAHGAPDHGFDRRWRLCEQKAAQRNQRRGAGNGAAANGNSEQCAARHNWAGGGLRWRGGRAHRKAKLARSRVDYQAGGECFTRARHVQEMFVRRRVVIKNQRLGRKVGRPDNRNR